MKFQTFCKSISYSKLAQKLRSLMKDFFANERWLVVLERCQLIKNIWHQTRYLRWRRDTNNVDLNPFVPTQIHAHEHTHTHMSTHTHKHTHTNTHTHFISYGVCNSLSFFSLRKMLLFCHQLEKNVENLGWISKLGLAFITAPKSWLRIPLMSSSIRPLRVHADTNYGA